MERNAPIGRKCDGTCTHPAPSLNTSVSLCSVCHEVFSCLTNFDAHRHEGWCMNPTELRKPMRKNARGIWIVPADEDKREVLERMRDGRLF